MSAAKVFPRYRLSVNQYQSVSFFPSENLVSFFYSLSYLLSIARTKHFHDVSKTDICSGETEIKTLPSYDCFRLFQYFSFIRLGSLSKGKETIPLF